MEGWRLKSNIKDYLVFLLTTLLFSIIAIVVVAAIGIAFAYYRTGSPTLTYAFIPNYIVGVVLMVMGVSRRIIPLYDRGGDLTGANRVVYEQRMDELRENKRIKRNRFIYMGAFILALTGGAEIVQYMMK